MAVSDKSVYVTFDVSGLKDAIEMLRAMPESVQRVSANRLVTLAQSAEKITKDETPVDTGKLAKSTMLVKKSKYKYDIAQTAKSGDYGARSNPGYFPGRGVRMGTRGQYEIHPFRAKALWWTKKKGSTGILRGRPLAMVGPPETQRLHPGIQRPFNYVDATVKRLQPQIDTFARQTIADVTQGAHKRFRTRTIKT